MMKNLNNENDSKKFEDVPNNMLIISIVKFQKQACI